VFDPIILNEPDRAGVVVVGGVVVGVAAVGVDVVPQPVKTKAITSISARCKSHFLIDLYNLSSP
jgi:hypothetical protein